MAPRLPFLASLAIVKESTWATDASGSWANFLRTVSESLKSTPTRERRAHMHHGDKLFPQSQYEGNVEAGGTTRFELTYDGLGLVFEAAFGSLAASSGPVGTQYTHTATPADTLPSFTIGNFKGKGTEETYVGMKATKLTISCSAGEQAFAEVEWIGEKVTGDPTRDAYGTTTKTFGDGQTSVLGWHMSSFTWDSETPTVRSFTFTLDNKLSRRPKLGSRYSAEPVIEDYRDVTVQATIEWESDAFWSGFQEGDIAAFAVSFAGAGDDELSINMANAQVVACDDPISGSGIITQSVTLRGLEVGADEAVTLVWKNDSSSATSNG